MLIEHSCGFSGLRKAYDGCLEELDGLSGEKGSDKATHRCDKGDVLCGFNTINSCASYEPWIQIQYTNMSI